MIKNKFHWVYLPWKSIMRTQWQSCGEAHTYHPRKSTIFQLILEFWIKKFFCFFFFFVLLGSNMQHVEVPRLGVQSELYLLAYTTAIATGDPSHICNLHHSSQQHQILNPLSETSETMNGVLMDASQICFC